MSGKYDKIINMTRPQYIDLPPMPVRDRAAQFSPFAAVVGYDDAVEETSRLTDARILLSEDEIYLLNQSLISLQSKLADKPQIKVTCFVPDSRKSGGKYVTKTGIVRKIDEYENILIFFDKEKIKISEIIKIEFTGK